MTARDIVRLLQESGAIFKRREGKHEVWDLRGRLFGIPHSRRLKTHVARNLAKEIKKIVASGA